MKRDERSLTIDGHTSYPSTPVGGPIEAGAAYRSARDAGRYPSTPVGGPIEAPSRVHIRHPPDLYPSTPVGGPIEARMMPVYKTLIEYYPSTPVGGPIEARINLSESLKISPAIRRRLSAAPLKQGKSSPTRDRRSLYPSTPVGGPIEAQTHRARVPSCRPYPSTPVGGPIEASPTTPTHTAPLTIRRRLSAAPLKHP